MSHGFSWIGRRIRLRDVPVTVPMAATGRLVRDDAVSRTKTISMTLAEAQLIAPGHVAEPAVDVVVHEVTFIASYDDIVVHA